ncbi:MAG TPA: hypothetical protein VF894_14420 [Anaeromyxobacter sp.]
MLGRDELDRAVDDGVLSPAQADALWARAARGTATTDAPIPPPATDLGGWRGAAALVGSLAAAGCVAWLLVAGDRLDGPGSLAVPVACGALAAAAARALERRALAASGVLAGLAVAMVPAAASAAQRLLGLSSEGEPPQSLSALVASPAFLRAVVAVVAAVVALRAFAAPILSAVVVGAVWFAVQVAAPLVFGPAPTWSQHALLSALLGLGALGAGVALDRRTRRDHAGWLYFAGLVAFWGGLTTVHTDSVLSLLLGAAVNLALVGAAVALRRRLFAVFGAIGVAAVFGHVAEATLADALLPYAIGAIGIAVAGGALGYVRLAPLVERAAPALLPAPLRRLLPPLHPR